MRPRLVFLSALIVAAVSATAAPCQDPSDRKRVEAHWPPSPDKGAYIPVLAQTPSTHEAR